MSSPGSSKPRRYPRATPPPQVVVAWRSASRNNIARFSSVGLGGMFIHEADPPAAGSPLQLIFETPNGQVRARATVRESQAGRGMGIEFTQMRPEERARLAHMIKKLLD